MSLFVPLSLFYNRCTAPYCACPCLLASWFLSLSHLYNLTPTVPCSEKGAVSTHTHTDTDVYTLHHHTYRLHCEPWLSSADNKSEEWPLAASLCLTLSLCNPSSLPLLIYTCLSTVPVLFSIVPYSWFLCLHSLLICFLVSSLAPPFLFLSSLFPVFLLLVLLLVSFLVVPLRNVLFSLPLLQHPWLVLTVSPSRHPSLPFISCSPLRDPLLALCLPLQLN